MQAQPKGKGTCKCVGGDRALHEFHTESGYEDPGGGGVLGATEELHAAECYLGDNPDEETTEPGLGSLVVESQCWRTLANRYQAFAEKKEIGVAGEWYLKDRTLGALTVEGQSGQGRVVCSLGKPSGGWRYVAAVVDRGAEETVAPSGLLPGRDVESPTQRVGGRCRAAIGSRRPNLGQQGVSFKTPEGHGRSLRFQVVDGRRPLIWGGGGRSEGADCFGMRGAFWADGRQDGEARGDRERERD